MAFSAALTMADTKAGTPCRYLDNGDGTVSDLDTGLQWEQKDNLNGAAFDTDPHDADNKYTWSISGSVPDGTVYSDFLAKLNDGASTDGGAMTPITGCFASHCDWRLPSVVELQGLVDAMQGKCHGGTGPCIDPTLGPTQTNVYWSASTDAGGVSSAWTVEFFLGDVSFSPKADGEYVRAVRGGF